MYIQQATIQQAPVIATLIMEAMTPECCQYFAGPHHTLDHFRQMLVQLVQMPNSQYSYTNTLVAMENDDVAGICVSYNGALLHQLRKAFVEEARKQLGGDFSTMPDETQAGELYIDSLAVDARFRRRGIAQALLKATAEKARKAGIAHVGLLVDRQNQRAQTLYAKAGFAVAGTNSWGGHPMLHMQLHTC